MDSVGSTLVRGCGHSGQGVQNVGNEVGISHTDLAGHEDIPEFAYPGSRVQ